MRPEENNNSAEEETVDEKAIILTEENAPALFEDTAEADEDDIELIDLTKEDE